MHIMIDLETMGTAPNAPIVAIGACVFDSAGVKDKDFYFPVSLESAVAHGAEMDASTVIWWLQQEDEARSEIVRASGDMRAALTAFRTWVETIDDLEGVWGNGASFDNVLLVQAYRRQGEKAPWPFWLDRCYRTVKNFSTVPLHREGTHHNALDDAISQANHLVDIWAEKNA